MSTCTVHPDSAATHRCDGCGRMLCAECVDAGHRLLTCRECGEMALPVAAGAAATAPELGRERRRAAAYSIGDALAYVFRGRGRFVFGSYVGALVLLAILGFVPVLGMAAGCFAIIFVGLVLLLVPGILYAIVRGTVAGDNELPDWPDFSQMGDRLGEIFSFLVAAVLAGVPLVLVLKLGDCVGFGSRGGAHCYLLVLVGWFLSMALWIPMFGAISVRHDVVQALRFGAHAQVVTGGGADFWTIVALATVLVSAGQFLSLALAALPVFGLAVSAAAGMYGWFTAAHLIGVHFRRNAAELDRIYG